MQDRKTTHLFLCITLVMAAIATGTGEVRAQFTMNSIGRDVNTSVAIPLDILPIDAYVINETQARVMQKQAWHERNNVDFQVRLTGMVTQFNKSWMTNNQNSVSSELIAYYYHIYTRDKYTSTFKFDGSYGMNYIDDIWFKNLDLLRLYYLMSWKMRDKGVLKNWAYSFETLFTSQFAPGYKSRTERENRWSNFMAPGTLRASLGFTYTSPDKRLPFIVTVSPISGNGLFILDDGLSDDRKIQLGIPKTPKADGRLPNYKIEGGSSLSVSFNRTFAFGESKRTSLQYVTSLSSFYGWMTQVYRRNHPDENIALAIMPTVRWDNALVFNPIKFLSMEFRTSTVYDRSQVDRIQMQYYLRVGLTYRYKNR